MKRTRLPSALLVALAACLVAVQPALSASDYPPGYEGYHTYQEMVAELEATAARYPAITRLVSIGRSYEGRRIWALKISDNAKLDEAEPEVLFESMAHSREPLALAMNLYLIRLLTQEYGSDAKIRSLVNSREIWIIPMLNPDGVMHDISGGRLRSWRKNRQPTPGSSAVGTDLNRNYGFKWASARGGSTDPASETYRGPSAWSAPETRVMRDFVASRVVGGKQQIRVAISWHSFGELIFYPYGYTSSRPPSMSRADARTFKALAEQMASRNGYRAARSTNAGTLNDWLYGVHRIFGFTFEMYPTAADPGFYPRPSVIAAQTKRNRTAVLRLLSVADCPQRAAGLKPASCS